MTATENTEVTELTDQVEQNEEVVDEGDVAADYLEELLDIADLDGDIDIEIRGGRTYISIVADEATTDLNSLVGKDGEVLDALQELTRLAALNATGERSRLVLDIAGYRSNRAEELQQLATQAIAEARNSGQPVHLDPMSAYERKLVHDVIADAGLHSESEGESTRRHIVVSTLDN
ncbi:RNA-binding protein [Glutamicibacter sp. BW80]|uniref:Jag family protein n=1 Tax=unclassified Glutamicibacter TaxID=2627139 RepID=UPI000BB75B05|nr:R3H domain-containing nucleic acid-binding protein [Glutamicibacter sp. BW80]PCC30572.1 RNA-binding protein [Glutamicibacter sp. BW80]